MEVLDEWDLAKVLSSSQPSASSKRFGAWNKWKASAYKTRVQLGLPVLQFEEMLYIQLVESLKRT